MIIGEVLRDLDREVEVAQERTACRIVCEDIMRKYRDEARSIDSDEDWVRYQCAQSARDAAAECARAIQLRAKSRNAT